MQSRRCYEFLAQVMASSWALRMATKRFEDRVLAVLSPRGVSQRERLKSTMRSSDRVAPCGRVYNSYLVQRILFTLQHSYVTHRNTETGVPSLAKTKLINAFGWGKLFHMWEEQGSSGAVFPGGPNFAWSTFMGPIKFGGHPDVAHAHPFPRNPA